MLKLTLAQMRRSVGRLTAAGIAIVIGTAFVAAAILSSSLIQRGATDALSANLAQADLVVDGELTADQFDMVADVEGVEATHASAMSFAQVGAGNGTDPQTIDLPVTGFAEDPLLRATELVDGSAPGTSEVVLPVDVADRLDVAIGDQVTLNRTIWVPADDPTAAAQEPDDAWDEGEWVEQPEQMVVTGLAEDPAGVFSMTGGTVLVNADEALTWAIESSVGQHAAETSLDHITMLVAPDADILSVKADLEQTSAPYNVRTREEAADQMAEELTGEANVIAGVGLGFAAIALIVAGLVISNTFQVLVAQRTRSLALLRCVGATTGQLRRSVTLEALLLGVIASLVGVAAGSGLVQVALMFLRRTDGGAGLPAAIEFGPLVVLVPLLAGTIVAWFASIAPARAASRVAPLAAMRPAGVAPTAARAGRIRLWFSLLLVVGGAAMLALGMIAASAFDVLVGTAIGILGGLLSFVGVLLGAVFWIPRVIGGFAALFARGSRPATKLAAANSLRNPRRTAATSSALLIGVTLVAMMSTGASTAQASFDQEFDRSYPVDVSVEPFAPEQATDVTVELDPARIAEIAALDGVEAVASMFSAGPLQIDTDQGSLSFEGLAVEPSELANVTHDPEAFAALDDDTILLPNYLADDLDIGAGDRVEVAGFNDQGSPEGVAHALSAQPADLGGLTMPTQTAGIALLSTTGEAQLDLGAAPAGAWVRLATNADASAVTADIQEIVDDDPVMVISPASERVVYEQIVSTLLAVVIGLLGVAVVIALVGVANTLSLSVIERRRESATLRAIGLTRRQLRQTLAIESMLIAGAGAVLGSLLGTFYGWVGTRTVLGAMADDVVLSVPWSHLGLILAVSLVAGVTASILPGRSAAKTSPVEALATE